MNVNNSNNSNINYNNKLHAVSQYFVLLFI